VVVVRPFFPDPAVRRIRGSGQVVEALSDRLGIAGQQAGDVFDAAASELGRFDGRIPATVLLGQPARPPLHHRFDIRRMGFHARLPKSGPPTPRFYPPSTKTGNLKWARS